MWAAAARIAPPETAPGKLCSLPLRGDNSVPPVPEQSPACTVAAAGARGRKAQGTGHPTYLLEELPQHLPAVDGAPAGEDTWVGPGPPLMPRRVYAPQADSKEAAVSLPSQQDS